MIINTNIEGALVNTNRLRQESDMWLRMERLSTGLRINRGADDPSGLGIATGMTSLIRGRDVAIQNIEDGLNLMRLQHAALMEVSEILNRMRDLAVRAANEAPLTDADRSKLNTEFTTLMDEIDRIAETTDFNTLKVLLGNPSTTTTDLEFEVKWWTADTDLDMHVIQPDGAHAWYANQDPSGHGEIDVDDIDGSSGPLDPAIEHYNVASGDALTGNYDLWINYYGELGGTPAAPLPDVVATVTISMYRGTAYENIQSFNVTATYQTPADEGDGPWSGVDGVPPYGEVFAGSYFWQPLSVPMDRVLQIGPSFDEAYTFHHDYFETRRNTLQIAAATLDTASGAAASIETMDKGIENVMNYLAEIGIRERRLINALDDIQAENINLSDARSHIQDADMAWEYAHLTIAQLVENVSMSAKVYADSLPRDVLTLLEPVI